MSASRHHSVKRDAARRQQMMQSVVAISEEPKSVVRPGGGNVVRMYCMREASIFNNIFFKDQVRRLCPSQSVLQRFAISSEGNNSVFDTHVEVC